MKFKVCLVCLLSVFALDAPLAANLADAGLRYIATRGVINCGTEQGSKIFANQDEDGNWHGIDVELCKMLSTAVFGRSDRINMVQVTTDQANKALNTNKIDIMVGVLPYSADVEITSQAKPVAMFYFDKQGFLARGAADAKSMEAFKGARVCVTNQSDDLSRLRAYSDKHKLELQALPFPSLQKAREGFLLKRCNLLTANYLLLRDILDNTPYGSQDIEILPETIVHRPVYIYVDKNNITLGTTVKWVANAAKLAEEYEITAENVDMAALAQDYVVENLLGTNPKLWKKFRVEPTWVHKYIKENGNFGEVYENTLGNNSKYKLPREKNNLLKNGGLITPDLFL